MSTWRNEEAFAASTCASVVLVAVNVICWNVGVDPPLQSEAIVHSTPALKSPVPSAMTEGDTATPERPPGSAFAGMPVMGLVMAAVDELLLKKSSLAPAPVSTNLFESDSTTSKLTEVPLCVTVTVPNDVAVPHPPVTWHDVKVSVGLSRRRRQQNGDEQRRGSGNIRKVSLH
jgi:hypothetical protein